MVLPRLSFRSKLPLALSLTAALTAGVMGAVLLAYGYYNERNSLVAHLRDLGDALAAATQPAVKLDDVWGGYAALSGGTAPPSTAEERQPTPARILLNRNARILASDHPATYRTGTDLASGPETMRPVGAWLRENGLPEKAQFVERSIAGDHIVLLTPVLSEQTPIGCLILSYPTSLLTASFRDMAEQGLLATILVMAVLVPVGWYLGHRIAQPLTNLAAGLSQVGREPPVEIPFQNKASEDEIGRLADAFNAMLQGLREKAQLERQVISNERLAALGRLTASVAHEVNNPLGGMLISLDTLRRRKTMDPDLSRTLDLLERGLGQIRQTVSALLVQSRLEDRALTPEDLEDLRTLVASRLEEKDGCLGWHNGLPGAIALPATPVRQIIINLLLNAVEALAERGGHVDCCIEVAGGLLTVLVDDDGPPIPPERLEHLFEPFLSGRSDGNGMGLWITYQLVQQLRGDIHVFSEERLTRFRVSLPGAILEGSNARTGT